MRTLADLDHELEEQDDFGVIRGVLVGLSLSIPIWALILLFVLSII